MELQQGLCPKCGKELQIPAELEAFSCLYCGARLRRGELQKKESLRVEAAEAYEIFLRNALPTVTGYPDSMERVTRTEFYGYFDRYYSKCAAPYEALETWVLFQGEERQPLLEKAAAELMTQLDAWFPAQKGWKLRSRRNELIERTKFTIAIFLVPTVRKCAPAIGEDFAKALREQWLFRYPNSPFTLTTYEELAAGFKKPSLCFITTAVCEFRGQPDDCEMLQMFREFRDGYLQGCSDGPGLIRDYYNCAPGIVSHIDYCGDRQKVYDFLYQEYLLPCQDALQAGDVAQCKETYVRMMRKLKKQYNLQ